MISLLTSINLPDISIIAAKEIPFNLERGIHNMCAGLWIEVTRKIGWEIHLRMVFCDIINQK